MAFTPTKKRSNLRDVANRSGVSVATVSRVLNSPGKVANETRRRVELAIAELKFVPSAAARAINRGRTSMVAALLPTLDNAIYARVVDGLEARLVEDQLSLIVAQTGDDPDVELSRARHMVNIGAEAMIVVGVNHHPELFELLDHTQIPTVAISYFDEASDLPTIGYDNWEAASIAAQHLVDLGHCKIAVLHGPISTNDRMRQRKQALQESDFDADFSFFEVSLSMEGGQHGVDLALKDPVQPTAILCFSDVIAHGALHKLHRLDVSVPGDVSLIGMEDLPASSLTQPALTSVHLSVEKMGALAAEAVSNWLQNDVRPAPINLPIRLVKRETTARAANST